jgi:hypothetical protein
MARCRKATRVAWSKLNSLLPGAKIMRRKLECSLLTLSAPAGGRQYSTVPQRVRLAHKYNYCLFPVGLR